jgi:hypothetical protein
MGDAVMTAIIATFLLVWQIHSFGQIRSIPGYESEQMCQKAAQQLETSGMAQRARCIPGPEQTDDETDQLCKNLGNHYSK